MSTLAFIGTLGPLELLLIFGVVVILFGASRLPQLGRGLGEGISNFKKGLKEDPELPEASTTKSDD
jgi:sec-independent protein translocase protein TatA